MTRGDDLGRVVIPKEIRRTMRIREGDFSHVFTVHNKSNGRNFCRCFCWYRLGGIAADTSSPASRELRPFAVPETAKSRYCSCCFDRGTRLLLALSAAGGAHKRDLEGKPFATRAFPNGNALVLYRIQLMTFSSTSFSARARKSSTAIAPRSTPPRARTATALFSISLSPMTSTYGTFCICASRIL